MKFSDWLDEKASENADVSRIELPKDISFDAVPDEIFISKKIILAGFSVQITIPFLRSNDLDIGF
jgi:hypothetical protein